MFTISKQHRLGNNQGAQRTVDVFVQASPAKTVIITPANVPKLKKCFTLLVSPINLRNSEA